MSEELTQATEKLSLENQTVIENNTDFNVKHPLNCSWTLWYTKPQTSKTESWADLLKPVITFSTVEEFWGIYNSIPQPSELPLKADYHLFREGIKPEWEDVQNAEGGKFNHSYNDKYNVDINDAWLKTCLALIGEVLQDDEDEVNGIVFSNRKVAFKVALWTKSTDKKNVLAVGEKFKEVLATDDLIEFYSHKSAENRNAKPLMMI
jgi:translation initiation factor 4E